VALLREDATMSMPPYPFWLDRASEFGKFLNGPGHECEGSQVVRVAANGVPAFAQYRRNPEGGYHAWSIHVLRLGNGEISGIDFFVDPNLFPLFGLPTRTDDPRALGPRL
jgi:RNA polymerase sigma-70 factor (ECF subfamily)